MQDERALQSRRIVLGVSGGIAAYKAVELLRLLQKEGAEVRVVMTKSATKFVSPLTFSTLSHYPVLYQMFTSPQKYEIEHISLAEFAELLLIAPATANIIGKIASGIADDLLTTTVMSVSCPIVIAPAMHSQMWNSPIVQENIKKLLNYGFHIIEPEEGELASGGVGKGRLASLDVIVDYVKDIFCQKNTLKGVRILITAGPTREYIDPVRFISNPSTGLMGFTLAEEALKRGAEVILVSGPTYLSPPKGCEFVPVCSAEEMLTAVMKHFDRVDCVIATAAVSDFAPEKKEGEKIKKSGKELVLRLIPTPDILEELGRIKGEKILVGFSAETGNVIENALKKMERKNLDLIVANQVSREGFGFGSGKLFASLIRRGETPPPLSSISKQELAKLILEEIKKLLDRREKGAN
ncbi:bifunctional phosphopantothenoylcysteine decarboxylase/phosphopantothenate--cysteine ligase CoaBC [bacterium]|nr:bifunctional phosphopantothenoylcysteine decarboxylase/phosphopantothenate--cysteine ligase CoaBC [bacterium]